MKKLLLLLIVLISSCDEVAESSYYQSDYYKENEFYSNCRESGNSVTECDLLYQQKKTMEAEEAAANRANYD